MSDILRAGVHQALSNSSQADEWSDEFLQELDQLGEGSGGVVHKVRDKRTDVVMARKTIAAKGASIKQLDRELKFMSSTSHPNIVKFYAAYVPPSSSGIKLLMEFCDGGSLEAVGKRIRGKGWRVSEKVAGRLAEGVSLSFCLTHTSPSQKPLCPDPSNPPLPLGVLDITGIGIPAHSKDYPPGHKAFKLSPDPGRGRQTLRFRGGWRVGWIYGRYIHWYSPIHGGAYFHPT